MLTVWLSGTLFALIHSILAADSCKQQFYRLGMTPQRYRLLYSLLAIILTAAWIYYVHQLPDSPLYRVEGALSWLLIFVQFCGVWIFLLSLKAFDTGLFLGFKAMPEGGEPFHEQGIYHHIRHPMYAGVMLVLLANPIHSVNSLNLALAICLYFVIGSRFEERRMLQADPAYADYKKRVPAFVPWRTLFYGRRSS